MGGSLCCIGERSHDFQHFPPTFPNPRFALQICVQKPDALAAVAKQIQPRGVSPQCGSRLPSEPFRPPRADDDLIGPYVGLRHALEGIVRISSRGADLGVRIWGCGSRGADLGVRI